MRQVAALFVRADSVYKTMPGVDAWDIERDARNYAGVAPIVAHPPCRAWGNLRHMANPRHDEKDLARWAVERVRRYAGVLEHPASSTLWRDQGLAEPGTIDAHGGRTITIRQWDFGHRAEKLTRLYFVGLRYDELPARPTRAGVPSHVVSTGHGLRVGDPGFRSRVTDAEREHTPAQLAEWLVELARRCNVAELEAA